ncbi:hypothetical protein Golomagni_07976 [Golovinomyces magnicellulatus]|nr:hypothetical protein Golomagni_07976 [Golovinomyces magnicellulatus]
MVISATKYAVIIMPVIVVLVYILQSFYLRTSRQMRYLDLEAKTPLYSQFTETLSGLEHVRAFGWKDETLAQSFKLLDHSQRAVYYMVSIQRWLLLMLDVLITIITLSLVALASYWTATTSQPSIGLGLLATTDWNVNVTNLINYWTRLETSLGAAERLRSFIAETPVEKDKSSKEIADWPTHGAIEFKNVTARYSSETVKALNDVSVNFETGQKVGIIGRTGRYVDLTE